MMVIKTVCNSWITSTRFHENERLPCIFGCNSNAPRPKNDHAEDSVFHYLRCPVLWSVIDSVLECSCLLSPEQRLCLTAFADPVPIVLAHGIYHSIKRGKRRWLKARISSGQFHEIVRHAYSIGVSLARR